MYSPDRMIEDLLCSAAWCPRGPEWFAAAIRSRYHWNLPRNESQWLDATVVDFPPDEPVACTGNATAASAGASSDQIMATLIEMGYQINASLTKDIEKRFRQGDSHQAIMSSALDFLEHARHEPDPELNVRDSDKLVGADGRDAREGQKQIVANHSYKRKRIDDQDSEGAAVITKTEVIPPVSKKSSRPESRLLNRGEKTAEICRKSAFVSRKSVRHQEGHPSLTTSIDRGIGQTRREEQLPQGWPDERVNFTQVLWWFVCGNNQVHCRMLPFS